MSNMVCRQIFLNGIIRKYKPKKLLEIGVRFGCSSFLILNSIKDFSDSRLYFHDILTIIEGNKKAGYLIEQRAPEFMNKWKLYTSGYIFQYIEEIGNGIDFVFLDSYHFLPGEVLDFLLILPFLSENAIIVLHDISINFDYGYYNRKIANNILFQMIRG